MWSLWPAVLFSRIGLIFLLTFVQHESLSVGIELVLLDAFEVIKATDVCLFHCLMDSHKQRAGVFSYGAFVSFNCPNVPHCVTHDKTVSSSIPYIYGDTQTEWSHLIAILSVCHHRFCFSMDRTMTKAFYGIQTVLSACRWNFRFRLMLKLQVGD